jgi:hypothetical protein
VIKDTMNSTKIMNSVRRIRYLPIAPFGVYSNR